jgi:hypothetical protein
VDNIGELRGQIEARDSEHVHLHFIRTLVNVNLFQVTKELSTQDTF